MEPERPIEKLLRAWARRRREQAGAPLELHRATRRLLQGEVARQFGSRPTGAGERSGWVWPFWPKVSWALAVLALVGLAGWLVVPRLTRPAKVNLLAKKEPARMPAPAAAPPAPGFTSTSAETRRLSLGEGADRPQRELDRKELAKADKDVNRSWAAASGRTDSVATTGAATDEAKAATPMGAPMRAGSALRNKPAATAKQESSALAGAPALTNPTPAAEAEALSSDQSVPSLDRLIVGQRFTQVNVQKAKNALADDLSSTTPVLVSFQVEETGQQLRIIDADGSVYTGTLQRTNAAPPDSAGTFVFKRSLAQSSAAGAGSVAQPGELSATNWVFEVSGTNRSLNQPVVFTGHLSPGRPLPGLGGTNLWFRGALNGGMGGGAGGPQPQPWPNARISGQAIIGGGQTLQIEALPAKAP